ncbi:hypothetical protein K461DRAFT_110839 [Myriangium duriaei CBS 260.36]|uniref:BZIP domain-containing protein n=1 Tax=Myriangium duriaei CBS 260.36 TaxID=1168546 RepID=A0A9P4J719_9PEZI|nr:hypothetical protein K461DRAFT_110839 [Myriangium duriaei CBS 260.36]
MASAAVAAMPSVGPEATPGSSQSQSSKSRKRKATDAEIDEKPRGRPRKNSKDESAAERRRTQIRLAQRAYRQRKETTIDELRQRVTELTSTVEIMDRGLRDFATTASQRGLPSQTLAELEALLQQFAPHVSSVRSPTRTTIKPEQDEVVQNISAVSVDPMRSGYREPHDTITKAPHVAVGLGYSMMLDNNMGLEPQELLHPSSAQRPPGFILEEEHYDEPQQPQTPLHMHGQQQQRQPHHQQHPQHTRFPPGHESKPALSMLNTSLYTSTVMARPRTVTPISANCNYEKSFARRLQRICIEAGYQLLIDPSKAPNAFQRVYRLHLSTGRDRNDLLARFALAVKRDINDNLDSDVSPFSYIGGAGLHYPDTAGCRRPETGSEEDRAALDVMASSIPGLGGEWLDTNDVQGYLHERGIKVDGSAMYIHASLPVEFLSTPPERIEVDGFLSQVSRHHNFEDVEEFHTRFNHLDDQLARKTPMSPAQRVSSPTVPESFHISTLGSMWNPASVSNIELGSLSDLMDTQAPHFFSIPGTASYNAMQDYMQPGAAPQPGMATSHRSSSSTAGSADGSTFSPPMGESDSVSSADADDAFEKHYPHQSHPSTRQQSFHGGTPATSQPFTPTSGPQSPHSRVSASNSERVTVTIDVCKLMKVLLLSSVCLGRAPGFRRWHIDAAIRSSIMTGF